MYMYTYVYMYIFLNIQIYIYINTYIYIHIHVGLYIAWPYRMLYVGIEAWRLARPGQAWPSQTRPKVPGRMGPKLEGSFCVFEALRTWIWGMPGRSSHQSLCTKQATTLKTDPQSVLRQPSAKRLSRFDLYCRRVKKHPCN